MDIEFVDELPPHAPRGSGAKRMKGSDEFASALRANPGVWAKWPFLSDTATVSYRRGISSRITTHSKNAPAALRRGFESRCRGGQVFIRFVGES